MAAPPENKESNTFSVTIGDWDSIQDEYISPVYRINGYPWHLQIIREQRDQPCDDVFLFYLISDKSSEAELWKCTATVNVDFLYYSFEKMDISFKGTHTFTSWYKDTHKWFIGRCSVKPNWYKIQFEITTKEDGKSWRPRPSVDFFATRDRILLIGEEKQKIHVNKESLASQSTFFESLFNGDFKEKNMTEIPIGDVEYEEFFNIIKMVYNWDDASLTDENVHRVLELSDRFDLKIAIEKVANFLLSSSSLSLPQKLLISRDYNLPLLRDILLSGEFTKEELTSACSSEEMKLLPAETVIAIIRMCCDEKD